MFPDRAAVHPASCSGGAQKEESKGCAIKDKKKIIKQITQNK